MNDTDPLYPWHDHHPSEQRPTGWHRHPDAHGWGDILHCHEPDDSYITIRRPDAAGAPRSGWTP